MNSHQIFETIDGAQQVISFFGHWPRFLDSEVLSIHLNRARESRVETDVWQSSRETDEKYRYQITHRAKLVFLFDQVADCEFTGFNHQNVINGISIEQGPDPYSEKPGHHRFTFNGIFGIDGWIVARCLKVQMEPLPAGL